MGNMASGVISPLEIFMLKSNKEIVSKNTELQQILH